MAPKGQKINKQTAARITRHMTFTISEKLEIIKTMQVLHARLSVWEHTGLDC